MKKFSITTISIGVLIFIFIVLNIWYSENNLMFISESMRKEIINWLNIEQEYSDSVELIRVSFKSSGASRHDKYRELIFKISKEEYEKNGLNYVSSFDSPEITIKGKKEYNDSDYMCIVRYSIMEEEGYNVLADIAKNSNRYTTMSMINFVIIVTIILLIIFKIYYNKRRDVCE